MDNIKTIFESLPGCYLILLPDAPYFTISDVNQAYLKATKKDKSIIGHPLFKVFPDNPQDPSSSGVTNLKASLITVLNTKRRHVMPVQRYDIQGKNESAFEIRYWKPANIPVFDENQQIIFIIHSVEDVTRQFNVGKYVKKRYQDLQKQISEVVQITQEMERMEISQELHDNIIQLLNSSRLYLGRSLQKNPPDSQLVHTGMELVQSAMEELRKISVALTDSTYEEDRITTRIEELLSDVFSLKQINITKTIALPDESMIESKLKLSLIRIIQEQLANVVKHSQAKNLWISLSFHNNQLQLVIKDDGIGFNIEEAPRGLGLHNIKTRVAMMNGHLMIHSSPGDGCRIEVHLPL